MKTEYRNENKLKIVSFTDQEIEQNMEVETIHCASHYIEFYKQNNFYRVVTFCESEEQNEIFTIYDHKDLNFARLFFDNWIEHLEGDLS